MRASAKGSLVGERVVGLAEGEDDGSEEMLGELLGLPVWIVGLVERLGMNDGNADGEEDGDSIAYEYISAPWKRYVC